MSSASSVVRRQVGRRLRFERERAGCTIKAVHEARVFSEADVARLEAGNLPLRVGDICALGRFYGTDPEVTDALTALVEGPAPDGWYLDYGIAGPAWFDLYLDLEDRCAQLSTYQPEVVPGLLRTKDYARAVTLADGSVGGSALVARRETERERQRRRLGGQRSARSLRALLGTGALSTCVGSPEVMQGQIAHLQNLDSMEGIDIRVRPWDAGIPPGIRGPFTILDFADPADPTVVYLESLLSARCLEQEERVAAYRRSFAQLWQQAVPIRPYGPAASSD